MPVVISMLRAVNVGGHHKISMDTLRALYESLGFSHVQTYVQSGNVVFKTKERDLAQLARRIENAIEKSVGFRPDVIVRTSSDLRDVIARNPFATRTGIEPNRLLVMFLAGDPDEEARRTLLRIQSHPEELRTAGRELYMYFPNGMARPKLSPAAVEKALKMRGTGRNWNTVTNLLAIAERIGTS